MESRLLCHKINKKYIVHNSKDKKSFQSDNLTDLSYIKLLLTQLLMKDEYTYQHSLNVCKYALALGYEVELKEDRLRDLYCGGLLHDVGKLTIPDRVLNKPDSLTDSEYQRIKEHPVKGLEILERKKSFKKLYPMVKYHHESYDGTGYPEGLVGEEIPLEARIIAVVDSFDAMTTNRCYQQAFSVKEAIEELERCSAVQFDPQLTKLFIRLILQLEDKLG